MSRSRKNGTGRKLIGAPLPPRVTNAEPAIISITAKTTHTDASWYLRVSYSVDGVAASVDVGDPHHPFHTAPDAGYPLRTLKVKTEG